VLVAPGFTQFDAHLGFRERWFDSRVRRREFAEGGFAPRMFDTVSRLRTEPGSVSAGQRASLGSEGRLATNPNTGASDGRFWGCRGRLISPCLPITLRVMVTFSLIG